MGMIGKFAAITPTQLQSLLDGSSQALSFLLSKEVDNKPAEQLNIDKDWHGLHFLLTGEPYPNETPLAKAILGGTEIGDDISFGPARYLTPADEGVNSKEVDGKDVG